MYKEPSLQDTTTKLVGNILAISLTASSDSTKEVKDISSNLLDAMRSIQRNLLDTLTLAIKQYRNNPYDLKHLYAFSIWRLAIHEMIEMEDDDKPYWFYDAFKKVPRELFEIYIAGYPSLTFERILEMLQYGYRTTFVDLKVDVPKKFKSEKEMEDAMDTILSTIHHDNYHTDSEHIKNTAHFITFLYGLKPKKIERTLSIYEKSESEVQVELATLCRNFIELSVENNPKQLSLI